MTPNKSNRGRPKGTGLNDAAQLRAIAGLMATDPDLKPTTAIKTLGITDPSVIRRLRDKFTALESELIAEIAPRLPLGDQPAIAAPSPTPTVVCPPVEATRPSARVLPLAGARPERKTEPIVTAADQPLHTATVQTLSTARPRRPQLIALPSQTDLPHWMGMGLSLYALSFEAQYAVVGNLFQWPPLAAILKSQVEMVELAVAMTNCVGTSSNFA